MKLEEIKKDMEVRVIKVESTACPVEEHYIGKIGKVIKITPNVPYPIEVDFGYKTGVFQPRELEEI